MNDAAERITPGPFSSTLGFRVVEVGDDHAVLEAVPGPEHLNGGGIVHGGYLSSLLDSATGWAVHAKLPPGTPAPHTAMSTQFLRAANEGERLICTARCLRAGRRSASADAEITRDGVVIARAMTTHTVLT